MRISAGGTLGKVTTREEVASRLFGVFIKSVQLASLHVVVFRWDMNVLRFMFHLVSGSSDLPSCSTRR